jgi:hypothetical protein
MGVCVVFVTEHAMHTRRIMLLAAYLALKYFFRIISYTARFSKKKKKKERKKGSYFCLKHFSF